MAVDSGACENVIDAEEMVPGFEIKQTKASMSGVKYVSATGEEILNLGEVVLQVITAEGTKRRMNQTRLHQPLEENLQRPEGICTDRRREQHVRDQDRNQTG